MINSSDKYDKAFQKLFQKTLEERPSSAFTEKLMQQINMPQSVSESAQKQFVLSSLSWIAMSSAFLMIGIGVLYYFRVQIISSSNFDILVPIFRSLRNSFGQIFSSFSVSPLTIAILFGILSLVIIDRLIRNRDFKKNISSLLY